jgi:hypothetical protein
MFALPPEVLAHHAKNAQPGNVLAYDTLEIYVGGIYHPANYVLRCGTWDVEEDEVVVHVFDQPNH